MRERAEGAGWATLDRPWGSDGEQVTGGDGQWMLVATAADTPEGSSDSAVAPHIAAWHPAVALAVADWLDIVAGAHEKALSHNSKWWNLALRNLWHVPNLDPALAVARAYLIGEAAA
jgi:hypothetical protein